MAAVTITLGVTVGLLTALLSGAVDSACALFRSHPVLGWCLPVVGFASYGLYRIFRLDFSWSTAAVLQAVAKGEQVPALLAPAIILGTFLTDVAGGSAGKEAAALQMGAAVSSGAKRFVKEEDRELLAPAAMAAAFGAMLDAPLAGVVFAFEAVRKRPQRPAALGCCLGASVAAWAVVRATGIRFLAIPAALLSEELMSFAAEGGNGVCLVLSLLVLGVLAGFAALVFCSALSVLRRGLVRLGAPVFALAAGGTAVALILGYAHIFGYGQLCAFCGTGVEQIAAALEGTPLPWWSFMAKAVLTLLTFAGGYKGGEVMPVLSIGACLGAVVSDVVLSAALPGLVWPSACFLAAMGAVAFFGACTKCPLTSLFLAAHLFGIIAAMLALPAVGLACICSHSAGLYPTALNPAGLSRKQRKR